MQIKKLTDFEETQLNDKVLSKIKGRDWFIEDKWGRKYFGLWTEEQAKNCEFAEGWYT